MSVFKIQSAKNHPLLEGTWNGYRAQVGVRLFWTSVIKL